MAESNGTRNGVTVPQVNGKATYAEKFNLAPHFIGGNKLANAPPSKVKDFVASHDGHTVITNVSCTWRMWLVARGILADTLQFPGSDRK